MTSGLAVTSENFQNFTCFSIFFDLKQLNRNTLVSTKLHVVCAVEFITPLCLTLSLINVCSN